MKDFFSIVKKYVLMVILIIFVIVLAATTFSLARPQKYQSSASLLIQPVREPTTQYQYGGYYAIQASEMFAGTILGWLKSPEVLSEILQEAKMPVGASEIQALSNQISARKIPPQNIELNVIDLNQEKAKLLASSTINIIKSKTELINKSASDGSAFTIISSDILTMENRPNIIFNVGLAFIIGLILGLVLVFLREYFSVTINFPKTASNIFNAPNIVTFYGKIRGLIDQDSLLAERFRFIRANILPILSSSEKIGLVVSGINHSEQSAKIAANLALSSARAGKRVILVDSDFDDPHLHELFALPNTRGFSELLFDTNHLDSYLLATPEENLKVVSAGMRLSYSADTIARADLGKLKKELEEWADLVIYNVAPLSGSSDAFPIFGIAKKALLVVKLGVSHIASAEYIHRFLTQKEIEQFVAVIN